MVSCAVAWFPPSPVAIMSKMLGPSSKITGNEKLPLSSTSATSSLMLTTAPAKVFPRIVMGLTPTTPSSAGSTMVSCVGVDVGVGVEVVHGAGAGGAARAKAVGWWPRG